MRLPHKAALITGAASGMGRAAAIEFAREGARVAMSDVNADALAETAALISDAGGVCISIVGDVSNRGRCRDDGRPHRRCVRRARRALQQRGALPTESG